MALSIFVPTEAHSETRISLNNQIFYSVMKWNTREASWYFSLLDVNKNTLMDGVKLCFGVCATSKLSNNPLGGNIYIVNSTDSVEDLGRNNFGQGLKYEFVYLTNSEESGVF